MKDELTICRRVTAVVGEGLLISGRVARMRVAVGVLTPILNEVANHTTRASSITVRHPKFPDVLVTAGEKLASARDGAGNKNESALTYWRRPVRG